jgi:MinD-like ATPase involved in chromosome partitioning or flagellar assembly
LVRTITSVRNQTFKYFEYIIIDGGSFYSDGTLNNVNSNRDTVIAVPKDLILSTISALKENKIKFKKLNSVPQPYHSPLMLDSNIIFNEKIKNHKF